LALANDVKNLLEGFLPRIPQLLVSYGWKMKDKKNFVHDAYPGHKIRIYDRGIQHSVDRRNIATVTHNELEQYLKKFHKK
jgi:hypothetical protein